jgi:ATP-dependent Clp protease ATP-binding subunit ClpC
MVTQLANQEALWLNHPVVASEHILLAIIGQKYCVATNILKDLGIDLGELRRQVETLNGAGPNWVTVGMLPQAPAVERIIQFAREEAGNLSANNVGSAHLLLGLLRENEGLAARVLFLRGINPDDIRVKALKKRYRDRVFEDAGVSYATPRRVQAARVPRSGEDKFRAWCYSLGKMTAKLVRFLRRRRNQPFGGLQGFQP